MDKLVQSDDSGVRLDRWLKENLQDVTYVEIQKSIRTGQVRVDGGRKKPNYRVSKGEKIKFPSRYAKTNIGTKKKIQQHSNLNLNDITIYDDESMLVINKPYGLSTQGGTKVKHHIDGLLSRENEDEKKYRLVHRLDKYTSGALIIAKKRDSASFYTKKFRDKQIKKTYLALTQGEPDEKIGVINFPLENPNLKKTSKKDDQPQEAMTQYEVIATTKDKISLIKLEPFTGRKHQIRKHLSMINTPIIGDVKYGYDNKPDHIEKRFYLHSHTVEFPCYSNGKNIQVKAQIPKYFEEAMKALEIQFYE
tara:strand:- start:312 stop:1229 length:918 start_codon:yes stop_codon:yes gene_type:complete